MKLEISHAVLVAFGPAADWLKNLSATKQAMTALASAVLLGFAVGGATVLHVGLPQRMNAAEAKIDTLYQYRFPGQIHQLDVKLDTVKASLDAVLGEHREMRNEINRALISNDEVSCGYQRLVCRVDGGSPNACDLRHRMIQGRCSSNMTGGGQ